MKPSRIAAAIALVATLHGVHGAEMSAEAVRQALAQASAERPADLGGKDLSELDLSGLDLRHARLRGASLFGSKLVGANLRGADLEGANLNGAWLMGADFAGANLARASLVALLMSISADREEWLRPVRLQWAIVKDLFRYGVPIGVGGFAEFVSQRWDNLLASGMYGPELMGAYQLAYGLAETPTGAVADQIGVVLLPSFSQLAPEERKVALVRAASLMGLLVFPLDELKVQPNGGKGLTLMDIDAKDPLVSVATFANALRVLGTGRGGKPREEDLKGAALAAHVGKRARKGKALEAAIKGLRVLAI